MVDAQARLKEMREGSVTHVVDHRRGKQWLAPAANLRIVNAKLVDGLLHQVQHAQAVGQPTMVGARIGQVAHAELVDAPQSLHFGAIE